MKILISIIGPTCIGKTKLSIYLSKKLKTEIISCDSRQFYKELNIGTSKPSKKYLKKIKHHLINNLNIYNNYNIFLFKKDVNNILIKLFKKYNIVIMVGGSFLYEKIIIEGINKLPNLKKKKLNIIRKKLYLKNINYLLKKLKKKDFFYFKKLKNKKDKKKIIRALEIIYITKKKISYFFKKKKIKSPFNKYIRIGLNINRKKIYKKINKNVDLMIKKGLLNEAKKLYIYKNKNFNALNTIGYKEFFDFFLKKKKNYKDCIEIIKKNTRNYAKKQIIWLKKIKNIKIFNPKKKKKILSYIMNKLKYYNIFFKKI